jgi:HK97 family phage major capsid protein
MIGATFRITTMDIKTLREEFAQIHADAGKVLTLAATEKRELTPEEKTANTARFARMDTIKTQVDDAKRLAQFAVLNGDADLPADPKGRQEFEAERTGVPVTFDAAKYKAGLNFWGRSGDASKLMNFAITSGSQSGAYIPTEVLPPVNVNRLPNAIRQVLAKFNMPAITRTLTESISIPVQDDTGNMGQAQSESATSGTSVDPTLTGSLKLEPTLYSSKQQWLSNTTVNAVDFDLFSYMLPMLYRRLDKVQESAWITDIIDNATAAPTPSGTNSIGYGDILKFEHSLPAAYRSDAAFIVSDSAYQQIRGLVDNNNRPIFDLDPTNSFQGTLHGKPVIVSDYMEAIGAGNTVATFCSASALFVFDAGLKRLARYILQPSFPDQTGFELFANGDFGYVNAGVRTLTMHT